jgi:hypothetical protein
MVSDRIVFIASSDRTLIGIFDGIWIVLGKTGDLRWWRHPQESLIC